MWRWGGAGGAGWEQQKYSMGKIGGNIFFWNVGLLTLTCQVARRQEAAGVGGGAIWGWSWVARAYIYTLREKKERKNIKGPTGKMSRKS